MNKPTSTFTPSAETGRHVLTLPGQPAMAAASASLNYIKRGVTANFAVYYDGAIATGPALADALLASCEWEYAMLKSWFGGLAPAGLPFNIYIDVGAFGAYHATCASTDIHCAAFAGNNPDLVRFVMAAEVDEVLMAAQNKGWSCGYSHGEGLSRVLATELYPAQLGGFSAAATWLDGTRPNWVDNTEQTDQDYTSIGCAVLFLNFLRYELTYSWNAIIAAAAPTLGGVYANLTGLKDGWARFSTLMQSFYPQGKPSGVTTDNPFPLARHGGSMLQGRFGNRGNFEAIQASSAGGLVHLWRNNDAPGYPWSALTPFAQTAGACGGASVIQSNYEGPGMPGNLEVVTTTPTGHFAPFWRDSGPAFNWAGLPQVAAAVRGKPALIQGKFGVRGNFEMVMVSQGGGLVHYWRDNDAAGYPWSGPTPFGAALGQIDAVTMIQSDYGKPGNLEVVARVGTTLYAFWRDSGPAFAWSAPVRIASAPAVTGQPCFVQSRFGAVGNFELVVPAASGGLVHLWRDNEAAGYPWSGPTAFGGPTVFADCTVIESNYGDPGNLEVLARAGGNLVHFWRDTTWHGPIAVASGL